MTIWDCLISYYLILLIIPRVFNNCIKYNGKTTNYGVLSDQCFKDLETLVDEFGLRKYIKKAEDEPEEKAEVKNWREGH